MARQTHHKLTVRDVLYRVHLVFAIATGIVILIISVTGTILAFRPQLIDFAEHKIRYVTAADNSTQLSFNELISKVRQEYPDSKPRGLSVKYDSTAAVAVNLGKEEGTVYVNPYTGEVLGKPSQMTHFLEKVEDWHRWLNLEGDLKPIGHQIKGACNIAFFIMIVTGIFLWWPRNWRWKTLESVMKLNWSLKGRSRDWNQHNVIGFWGAPFLIVITLTGVVMSYQWANNLVYRMAGNEPPVAMKRMESSEANQSKGKSKPIDYDMLITQAKEQVPGWASINMRLAKPGEPVHMTIDQNRSGNIPKRSQLTIDPSSGQFIKWEPYSEQTLGRTYRIWARYLHTGEAGGIIGQTIAFLAALGTVFLVWTGFVMAWQRFCVWRSKRQYKKEK